jgi:hypothetical protein
MRARSRLAASLSLVLVLAWVGACNGTGGDDGPADEGTQDGGSESAETGTAPGGVLGCPAGATCTLLFVAQTLDDRVEIFAPDDPDGVVYRGSIGTDFKPNGPDGDNAGELLDEPYGMALTGGFLHILAGHFPSRTEGSLVALPVSFLAGYAPPAEIPTADLFAGAFVDPVVGTALGNNEPIWALLHEGRLLVGTFNNDLLMSEATWTNPGRLLVLDADDPALAPGVADLGALMGGPCNGAAEVVRVGPTRVAVACDGNDVVAMLEVGGVAADPLDAAAATVGGTACMLPVTGRRVRHLAHDGVDGVLVGAGPGENILDPASIVRVGGDCSLLGLLQLPSERNWILHQIAALGGEPRRWLVASGAGNFDQSGARGIYVVYEQGGLELCPEPIAGFEAHFDSPGGAIDPFAILAIDATHVAVGAGPFEPPTAGAGYGKVLWATLSGGAPCELVAEVVDLTDGAPGHAPAVDPAQPQTFRRAPNQLAAALVAG